MISERIKLAEDLMAIPIYNEDDLEQAKPKYYEWDAYNTELLKRIFNTDELSNEYSAFYGAVMDPYSTIDDDIKDFKNEIQDSVNRLTSIRTRLSLFVSFDMKEDQSILEDGEQCNEIFIVHGRNEGVKLSVVRFLEKLSLKPIILSEQPNEGKTIIEKIEANADVGFAIVLLTPDDIGGLDEEGVEQKLRARQNVLFELGYFVGKLGRSRVCVLNNQKVELPSDIIGVAYIAIDATGAWKLEVAKELKAAGYIIDGNKLL